MNFIWKNGAFHSDHNHLISTSDRALRGDGVFDTMLCVDGKPIHLERHISRLARDGAVLGLFVDADRLAQAIKDTIGKNGAIKGRYCISTTLTRGEAERGLKTPSHSSSTLFIRISHAPENHDPIHAIIAQSVRRNEGSPLSQVKSLNYGDNILARREAESQNTNEAILLNNAGRATCFTVGNLFILKDGQVSTPPLSDGVLDGIIRGLWIDRSAITERPLSVADLESAEAIFMSNSLRGIVPLASLNGKTLAVTDFGFDPDIHLR